MLGVVSGEVVAGNAGRGVWRSGVQAGGMLGMPGVAFGEVQSKWVQGVLWSYPSFEQIRDRSH